MLSKYGVCLFTLVFLGQQLTTSYLILESGNAEKILIMSVADFLMCSPQITTLAVFAQ